jgi:hypothetical protein
MTPAMDDDRPMTCADAIRHVFGRSADVHTTADVVAKMQATFPDRAWKTSTIGTYLIGLSVNHTSAHHYPTLQRRAFLRSLGNGRYRLWRRDQDGPKPVPSAEAALPAPRGARLPTSPSFPAPTGGAMASLPDRPERRDLVQALVQRIHTTPFRAGYRRRPYGDTVKGWPDRLRTYFWPHPHHDLAATDLQMQGWFTAAGALSEELLTAGEWTPEECERAHDLALKMLGWGRVPQRTSTPAVVESVFRRSLGMPGSAGAPMNSGWTKVAALATAYLEGRTDRAPHVIWDSRVSTSLVTHLEPLVMHAGLEPKQVFPGIGAVGGRGGTRPRRRELRWAAAYGSWTSQDAGSALVREIRDVLNQRNFGLMPTGDGEGPWTIRGVESVLFMDGY